MPRRIIRTEDAPAPVAGAPYSQAVAVAAGELLFVSGQVPLTPGGELVPGGVAGQTRQCLANIDAIILAHGYDCDVSLVPGDTMATFTTMDVEGKPDVAPELWINAYRDQVDAAVKEGRLHIAARALTDGGVEGWWIPNYIAEAYPEIRTVRDALDHPELFPDPQNIARGAVHNLCGLAYKHTHAQHGPFANDAPFNNF